MLKHAPLFAVLLLAAGCAQQSAPPSQQARGAVASAAGSAAGLAAPGGVVSAGLQSRARALGAGHAFASQPDRGDLIAYPATPVVRRDGAYTWHRADLSEAHAIRAIATGLMRVRAPSGDELAFRYDRHEEYPNGDWTWIGHLVDGTRADDVVVTFGARAAFGTIAQPGKAPLRLTVRNGVSWLVDTDRAALAKIHNAATDPTAPDYLVVPRAAATAAAGPATSAGAPAAPVAAAATTAATPTVDLVLGYTTGFASALGGQSQANTRLNNLVAITNEAYVNSQVPGRVRLVGTVQVSYPDNTDNSDALEKLSGYKSGTGGGKTTPDAAFGALRAARDRYGADLVSLVRKFNDPENDGCGIAWLIGGSTTGTGSIHASDEYFGYSVVSDGSDGGYYCREETLAHELGHNMGAQHDRAAATENGKLSYGIYPYSFGYKTGAGAGNFYTIMAYGDKGQATYRTFSNPRTMFCGGYACGVADQADVARTLGQTMPIVATFRATVATTASRPDLVALSKIGASGSTEVHTLSAASSYTQFSEHLATGLGRTGTDYAWAFDFADYNHDGTKDLYLIARQGASNTTEIHVLNGADGYRSFLLHTTTALHRTGSDNSWVFRVGDYNRDGVEDVYAIAKNGASGRTEIHVLNGATGFQSFLVHVATPIGSTGSDAAWDFALADFNQDGSLDMMAIAKLGASQTTEVHVLNGANGFQNFLLQTATALHQTGAGNQWNFKAGDYNGDGVVDLYCINKVGSSGATEVHVLDGSAGYGRFLVHLATGLYQTGTDNAWDFLLR